MLALDLAPPSAATQRAPGHGGGARALGMQRYTLGDLETIEGATPRADSRLLRALMAASSAAQREAVLRERLFDMGFDWMSHCSTAAGPDGQDDIAMLVSCAEPDWVCRYFEAGYDSVDPRMASLADHALPQSWDLASVDEQLDRQAPGSLAQRFARDLHASGIGSGVTIHVSTAQRTATVSLESCAPSRRWIDDRVLGEALHFALNLHHYLSHHTRLKRPSRADWHRAEGRTRPGLPATQQAILCQLAQGLTDREIASRLQLGTHTVDYHLRQLRQRFAVRNRVQLVSAAAQWTSSQG